MMDWDRLIKLPRELKGQIFKYLSASELLAFQDLGSRNPFYYTALEPCCVRVTDLCDWNHFPLTVVKTYLLKGNRWKHIRKLCLNDLIRSADFLKQINFVSKFRQLQSLHIVNCQIHLEQLQSILSGLPQLSDLSWSLMVLKSPDDVKLSFEQIEKFHIESYLHGSLRHKQALLHVLKWFPNMEYLSIHFASTVHTVAHSTKYNWTQAKFSKLHSFVCTSETFDMFHSVTFYCDTAHGTAYHKAIVHTILQQRGMDKPWKKLWILNSSEGVDLHKLVQGETELIGMSNTTIKDVEPQPIIEMGSPCVKFVQIDTCQIESAVNQEELLTSFFSLCCNITEMNLFNTHFDPLAYPCRAIATLRRLKKLLIPVCCIAPSEYEMRCAHNSKSNAKRLRVSRVRSSASENRVPMQDIIEGCPDIVELDVRQFTGDSLCSICRSSTKGDNLGPIHQMKNLQSLTLVGIQAHRIPQGKFLEAVGQANKESDEFCKKLTTLRLYFVGQQTQLIYSSLLKSAFCNLTCLRDISLQHSMLHLESSSFWEAFSQVTNLERLCLAANFTDKLPIQYIQDFFLRVPKLYVFHIHSRANNFNIAATTLKRFVSDQRAMNDSRVEIEIVIQHLTMHIKLTTTERIRHDGRIAHIQELCAPGTSIAQIHHKCGIKAIL